MGNETAPSFSLGSIAWRWSSAAKSEREERTETIRARNRSFMARLQTRLKVTQAGKLMSILAFSGLGQFVIVRPRPGVKHNFLLLDKTTVPRCDYSVGFCERLGR